jgi:hypothetical protein
MGGRRPSDANRGQIVLLAALVLATTLVGLALVLNTVIFTENLATKRTTEEIDTSQEYREVTNETVGESLAIANTNPNNVSHSRLVANVPETMGSQTDSLQRDAAVGGGSVSVSVATAAGGFLLKQDNTSRNFTAGGAHQGERNWTLVTDAKPDDFRQNLSRAPMFNATVETEIMTFRTKAFNVQFHNDSATWRVYVMQDAATGHIYFVRELSLDPLEGKVSQHFNQSCFRRTENAVVDYHAGTVDGTPCGALSFYPNLSEVIDVTYNNTEVSAPAGSQVRGTYKLRVRDESVHRDAFHAASDGRSPFKLTALLGAEVVMTHETTELVYEVCLDVTAPSLGRYESPERAPNVTSFTVTDNTDDAEKYDFQVSFQANDPDGNLDNATFILTDDEGREVDKATVQLSGGIDSATQQFKDTSLLALFEDDGNFTLQVIVNDATNRTDIVGETHRADGDDVTDPGDENHSYGGPWPRPPAGAAQPAARAGGSP